MRCASDKTRFPKTVRRQLEALDPNKSGGEPGIAIKKTLEPDRKRLIGSTITWNGTEIERIGKNSVDDMGMDEIIGKGLKRRECGRCASTKFLKTR